MIRMVSEKARIRGLAMSGYISEHKTSGISNISMGAFKQSSLSRAMPLIAVGIAGIVAYNIFRDTKD